MCGLKQFIGKGFRQIKLTIMLLSQAESRERCIGLKYELDQPEVFPPRRSESVVCQVYSFLLVIAQDGTADNDLRFDDKFILFPLIMCSHLGYTTLLREIKWIYHHLDFIPHPPLPPPNNVIQALYILPPLLLSSNVIHLNRS